MNINNNLPVKVSYLLATDSSIGFWNQSNFQKICNDFPENFFKSDKDKNSHHFSNNRIQVHLRIKKENSLPDLYEIEDNILICQVPEGSNVSRQVKDGAAITKKFNFSRIFDSNTTQLEIFNTVIKPKIVNFINGKTFTLIGTDEEPGVLPRAMEYLFRTLRVLSENSMILKPSPSGDVQLLGHEHLKEENLIKKNIINNSTMNATERNQNKITYEIMREKIINELPAFLEIIPDVNVSVWVSFAEIYNENIYDLLQPLPKGTQRPRLGLGNLGGFNFIKNLSSVYVTNGLEAFQILQYGLHNLKYAETSVNAHSSRSHAIFTIKIVQYSPSEGGHFVNYFNFCDLAGAERSKKTQNVGIRQQESNNINTSLLVLGRCIQTSRLVQKNGDNILIPFRESKLTQLFQRALSGHEDIAMVVNISPLREMFDETYHVLNFSAIAKDIKVITKPLQRKHSRFTEYLDSNNTMCNNTFDESEDINELYKVIEDLQIQLYQQQLDGEHVEESTKTRLIEGYRQILRTENENWQNKLEYKKREMIQIYEQKIATLKRKFGKYKIHDINNNIIDSHDNDDGAYDDVCEEDSFELDEHLEHQIIKLKFDNATFSQKLIETEECCKELEKEKNEYIEILADAKIDYEQLEMEYEERCSELSATILVLTERNNELENELNDIRKTLASNGFHEFCLP